MTLRSENLYTPDCIRTASGQYVNVFDPKPETIIIEDIAHSLSMQCRFGAHLPHFYSVAQHCVNCSKEAQYNKLEALMHDASEAYLMDIPKPVKVKLANYKTIEDKLMFIIAAKFGFNYPLTYHTKQVDELMLNQEWLLLMLQEQAIGWSPRTAKETFLRLFYKLST